MSALKRALSTVHRRWIKFIKKENPLYQDTICDSLAIWEEVYSCDEYLESIRRKGGEGIWAAREVLASSVMPTIREYYNQFGCDIDFDGVFVPDIVRAMHLTGWDMDHDYSDVCKKTRSEWLNEDA